jgi:protein ImuA
MSESKTEIIARLQKDIFPLQGLRPKINGIAVDAGLEPIKNAFPGALFPLGAVHEFLSTGTEDASATDGFIACLLGAIMQIHGVSVWISSSRMLFPPALKAFGIEPDRIIFLDLQKQKDILWVMEEALKCNGLAVVVAEMQEINFTESRRLQLAVEQSGVTGFILRRSPRKLNTTACVSRWKITSLPSELANDMPGVGFPRWNVGLLKIRNGKPGTWQMEWAAGKFQHVFPVVTLIPQEQKRKTG